MGMGEVGTRLLDLIFPRRCVACRRAGGVLCAQCAETIRPPSAPLCVLCGASLASGRALGSAQPGAPLLCAACRSGAAPLALDGMRAVAVYEGATRAAIIALKYEHVRSAARPLGELLAEECARQGWRPDALVPMPLGAGRRRERGYNQAELLARSCGRRLGVPVLTDVLLRTRETTPQVRLSRDMRRSNVQGAFALTSAAAAARLAGRRVVMIDDVTTTGSTLDAAASALRAAQPAMLWGLAVARADLGRDSRGEHGRESSARNTSADSAPQPGATAAVRRELRRS